MPLKTLVKVGCITNLSDARYCAGMGVDMLGFRVIEGVENYISPKLYQEIRGWVSGPKVVAECYGISPDQNPATVIEHYAPDFIELTFQEYLQIRKAVKLPFIVYLAANELQNLEVPHENIAYWIVDEESSDVKKAVYPVLLKTITKAGITEKLEHAGVKGLALNGSSEIRPGYKNYDDLADVLEMLDM
jgi:phosphoribosylanthranilate isomerase